MSQETLEINSRDLSSQSECFYILSLSWAAFVDVHFRKPAWPIHTALQGPVFCCTSRHAVITLALKHSWLEKLLLHCWIHHVWKCLVLRAKAGQSLQSRSTLKPRASPPSLSSKKPTKPPDLSSWLLVSIFQADRYLLSSPQPLHLDQWGQAFHPSEDSLTLSGEVEAVNEQ